MEPNVFKTQYHVYSTYHFLKKVLIFCCHINAKSAIFPFSVFILKGIQMFKLCSMNEVLLTFCVMSTGNICMYSCMYNKITQHYLIFQVSGACRALQWEYSYMHFKIAKDAELKHVGLVIIPPHHAFSMHAKALGGTEG